MGEVPPETKLLQVAGYQLGELGAAPRVCQPPRVWRLLEVDLEDTVRLYLLASTPPHVGPEELGIDKDDLGVEKLIDN